MANNNYTGFFKAKIGQTIPFSSHFPQGGQFTVLSVEDTSSQVLVQLDNGYNKQVKIKNSSGKDLNSHLESEFQKSNINLSKLRVIL